LLSTPEAALRFLRHSFGYGSVARLACDVDRGAFRYRLIRYEPLAESGPKL
jgi:hypothetical protein